MLKKHPLGNDSDSLDDSNNGDADKDDIGDTDGIDGNIDKGKVVDVDQFNNEKLFRLI